MIDVHEMIMFCVIDVIRTCGIDVSIFTNSIFIIIIIIFMIDITSELFTSSHFQTLHDYLNNYYSIY